MTKKQGISTEIWKRENDKCMRFRNLGPEIWQAFVSGDRERFNTLINEFDGLVDELDYALVGSLPSEDDLGWSNQFKKGVLRKWVAKLRER